MPATKVRFLSLLALSLTVRVVRTPLNHIIKYV